MKELKVGERVIITLEAVESIDCEECFFERKGRCNTLNTGFLCSKRFRSDGKSVIFKEIKE